MYYLLSLLMGVLVAVMIAFNGGLSNRYGAYSATIIIHITGLALIAALALSGRGNGLSARQKWYLYSGGAIGVANTVFVNLAFGAISVSAILALALLGQSVASMAVDGFGLLGMPKTEFNKRKALGLIPILCGIAAMIDNFELAAVLFAFLSGVSNVVSRTFNARLAEQTSVKASTLVNYIVGLSVSVPAYMLLGRGEPPLSGFTLSPQWYIYLGGATGVCVVLLSNMTVAKVSAFYFSLLTFIGQVFTGVVIDAVILREFSARNIIGGVLVAAGLGLNLLLDGKGKAGNSGNEEKGL